MVAGTSKTEPTILLPRFTIRLLLWAMLAASGVFFVGYLAVRGYGVATGVFATFVAAGALLPVLSIVFLPAWLVLWLRPTPESQGAEFEGSSLPNAETSD